MSQQNPQKDRRDFLKKSLLAGTGFFIVPRHVLGGAGYIAPSEKVTLGFIGLGRKGLGHGLRMSQNNELQYLAACDVDATKMKRWRKRVKKSLKKQGKVASIDYTDDFRTIIDRKDIDAVVISTPDHWHAIPAIAAMKAGKDVYGEKPLTRTIEEGRAMVKAARKYDRIFQTGSQQRSAYNFRHAAELVRNGYIGEIKQIRVWLGTPTYGTACELPEMDVPKVINWDAWIGPAPYRGYHNDLAPRIPEKFWPRWRYYKEFGGGMLADWGAHMFDIIQWALDMDHTGPVLFTPPTDPKADTGLTFQYANGIKVIQENFGRGNAISFEGSEGTIQVSRSFVDSTPKSLAERKIGENEKRVYFSDNHTADFVQAVKTRKKPIADVEIGHRTNSICCIANFAYWLRRPLKWDPTTEAFEGDVEANALRGREDRAPYAKYAGS